MQQEQEDLGKEREVLSLIKKRSGKLGALTRKRNEIHTLIDNGENTTVIEEHMKVYNRFLEEFMDVQVAVQSLLNEDERESDHTDWYEPKLISCREFIDDIETWLKQDASQDAANNVSAVENVSHAASRKSYDVEPHDSVSQTAKPARPSSKAAASKSSSSSSASRKSKTLSEMAIQAELERVTLLKQADALQEKHALELEEAQLNAVMKAKRETLSVKTNLAIAKAKSQVFKEQEETQKSKSLASSGASTPTQFISPQRAMKQTKMSPAPVPLSTVGPTTSVAPPIYAKSKAKTRHLQQSADSNNDQPDLAEAMRRQNEITAMLIKQQRQSLLPPIQVPVFDGDPLQFRSFIKAFEQGIESKTDDMQVKLYYLEQFTSGQPRKLVQSCMHMSPQTAFGEAKRQLEWNFGSKVKVTAAFLNKALDWPALKADDGVGVALRSYTFFLRTSYNTTEDAGYLDEMENSSHMKVFVSKLPFRMRESWRMKVCSIREEQKRRVKFKDLLDFLERQVRAAMDPVFCEIQNTRAKATTPPTPKSIGKAKGSSFATSVAQVPHQSDTPNAGNAGKIQCLFCNDGHILDKCTTFKKKPNKDKITFLQSKGVCFGCLVQGHLSRNCQERLTCRTCSKNHPTVLHIEPKPQNTPADHETQTVSNALVSLDSEGDTGVGSKECSLSVLPVKVRLNKSTKVIETYAFLDPGSSATFCTESLMTQLNAPGQKMDILLKTMGQEKYVSSHKISGLEVAALNDNKFLRLPDVYTQKSIPVTKDNIPKEEDLKKWPYLQEVELTPINASIGLLIGANAPKALEPWKIVNSEGNGPYAVQTRLGWVINGPLGQEDSDDSDTASVQVNRISLGKLEEMLIKQYNQDFVEQHCDEHAELSVEDKQFMEIMSSSATLTNGHYYLKLPFRDSNVVMPNNKQVAQQRAQQLLKRFKRDQSFFEEYKGFMQDVSTEGYAEIIPQDQLSHEEGKVWFLPHHGVYHPRKKTLRVVFDCASCFAGTSLNKQLLQGPDLTNTLLGVLTRFRQGPMALMTDIKGMFHQVRVAEEHANYLRFLWWPNGDLTKDLAEHRMLVHIFGAVSSPSCATYALLKTAEDNAHLYPEEAISTIRKNFYVDDALKSVHSVEQATSLYQQLTEVCAKGGFKLNKWICSDRSVLSEIPEADRASGVKTLDLSRDQLPMERALGVQWDVEQDSFTFSILNKHKPLTRRGILSSVSSIYDPLGFLSPVILPAKQILQQLCKLKLAWDEAIPPEMAQTWQRWVDDLILLHSFSVRRCFTPSEFGNVEMAQLHHFCDASEVGFGAVSYLRLTNSEKEVCVAFVIGKARVAPLKHVTIPRLELAAAVVAVRLDKMLSKQLELNLSESVFWSDSMTVLKYIANTTTRFKTYVANRVSIISSLSNVGQWRHVGSKMNPADAASRGMKVGAFLKSSTWITGPDFLGKTEREWPASVDKASLHPDADPEVREEVLSFAAQAEEVCPTTKLLLHFSSWTRLKRAVAWIMKLKEKLRLKIKENAQCGDQTPVKQVKKTNYLPLTVDDLLLAEEAIVRFVQKKHYSSELAALKSGGVKKSSQLYKLDPIAIDDVLRVGGRLSRSALPVETKHPAILPKESHVSKLILQHVHNKVGHRGRNHMLSTLRRQYWIPHANAAARKIISECVICLKQRQRPGEQKMSDLPVDRVTADAPPFTHVGLDYFGPIEVKKGRSLVKRYGALFTCLTCRAVHLEVAHSLNTDSCINAIRRFICRRGQVKEIRTDNGTNFVSTNRELKQAIAELNHSKIQKSLMQDGIKWTFNPPYGAHHGGVWERLVQDVKRLLRSVTNQQALDDEALQTVFCEAEAILNDRPITTSSGDPNDIEALTPNHLLQLKGKPILPPGLFKKDDLYARRRWRQVQYIADLFWKRWTTEYLPQLQERQKWNKVHRNFTVGDIVLVVEESAPRGAWPIGRITDTMADSKGCVRRVRVKTQTNELEKPITKICLLVGVV